MHGVFPRDVSGRHSLGLAKRTREGVVNVEPEGKGKRPRSTEPSHGRALLGLECD